MQWVKEKEFFRLFLKVPESFMRRIKTGLSQFYYVWQLFINHTVICYDNLLLLQLNIKKKTKKEKWTSPLLSIMPEISTQ